MAGCQTSQPWPGLPLGKNFVPLSLPDVTLIPDDREGGGTSIGVFGWLLFGLSWCLVAVTLPFSLCVLLKVPTSNRKQTQHTITTAITNINHNIYIRTISGICLIFFISVLLVVAVVLVVLV